MCLTILLPSEKLSEELFTEILDMENATLRIIDAHRYLFAYTDCRLGSECSHSSSGLVFLNCFYY